jgi:hypothetical protein
MSWHRRHNKRARNYDKREHYLILRLIEAQRETLNTLTNSGNPIERQLLTDLNNLEAKARAEWAR